jgi:hypothetical protein
MCGGPVVVLRSQLDEEQRQLLDTEFPFKMSAAHQYLPKDVTDQRYMYGMIDGLAASHVPEQFRGKVSYIEAKDIER